MFPDKLVSMIWFFKGKEGDSNLMSVRPSVCQRPATNSLLECTSFEGGKVSLCVTSRKSEKVFSF